MTGGLGWQCGAALNIELVETGHWTRGGLDVELLGDWTITESAPSIKFGASVLVWRRALLVVPERKDIHSDKPRLSDKLDSPSFNTAKFHGGSTYP